MATPTRAEVERAFQHYLEVGAYGRDWNTWANLFTEDAVYIEAQYGTFHGREAIRKWITTVMAGVPDMYFPPVTWQLIDNGQVCFCIDNAYPNPTGGAAIAFPTVTYLRYRDGLWCREEDIYDVRASLAARAAFRAAGGNAAPAMEPA
jgi:ketosteroid isomerase-like protein